MILDSQKGLRRLSYSSKDYLYHPTFGTTSDALPGLPAMGLGRKPLAIKNQGFSNYCTAYGTSSASEYQEKEILSPEYQAAKIGEIVGAPIYNGAQPRDAMKAALSYGSLPSSSSPYTFQIDGWVIPAEWQSYNVDLDLVAAAYKKQSYYSVTFGGPDDMDVFDSIRLALWDAKDDNGVVMAFGWWYQEWNGTNADGIAPMPTNPTNRHCYLFIDWTTINGVQYLVAQLSSGLAFGDNGLFYFSRSVVNYAWKRPALNGLGLYIFRDKKADVTTQFNFGAFISNVLGSIIGLFQRM